MGMAWAAQKLFEENIKYSNGEPVKVVIADTTIGRETEAAACEEKYRMLQQPYKGTSGSRVTGYLIQNHGKRENTGAHN